MNIKQLHRFVSRVKVDPLEGCWLWINPLDKNGYGRLYMGKDMVSTHRISYEHWVGKIPNNLEVDHLCRNRSCCNPNHLELVTHIENIKRGINKNQWIDKTHCIRGHPFSGDNLYLRKGGRQCKKCKLQWKLDNYDGKTYKPKT